MIIDWSFIGMSDVEQVIVLLCLFLLCPFMTVHSGDVAKFNSATAILRVAKESWTIKKPECFIV